MDNFSLLGNINPSRQNGNTSEPLPTSADDPRLEEAKQYVKEHGGNAKDAALRLCQEKMLNPVTLINRIMGGQ